MARPTLLPNALKVCKTSIPVALNNKKLVPSAGDCAISENAKAMMMMMPSGCSTAQT